VDGSEIHGLFSGAWFIPRENLRHHGTIPEKNRQDSGGKSSCHSAPSNGCESRAASLAGSQVLDETNASVLSIKNGALKLHK